MTRSLGSADLARKQRCNGWAVVERLSAILDFAETEGGTALEGLTDLVGFLSVGGRADRGDRDDDGVEARRRKGRPHRVGDDEFRRRNRR
jgi:hypothetical protein